VGEDTADSQYIAKTWAEQFNVQQQIGATVSTEVASHFAAVADMDGAAVDRSFHNELNSLINAQYPGAKKMNDWWVQVRSYDPDDKKEFTDAYTAYVLYTIPRTILDSQVSNKVAAFKAADAGKQKQIDAVAERIRTQGLEGE
jgi:ABC-type transporter MlaC component